MIWNETSRLAIVNDLIELTKPLDEIKTKLAEMGWDYDGAGVELKRRHLTAALQRFLQNSLSAKEIEFWANLIENREDVRPESHHEAQVEEVLHQLANPSLTQPLDRESALALIVRLTS